MRSIPILTQQLLLSCEKAITAESPINNWACASCHAWLDQDQVQIHQWHLLTQRQMSSCQVVSQAGDLRPQKCRQFGASWSSSWKKAAVFCFFFPFGNALTSPRLPLGWVTKWERKKIHLDLNGAKGKGGIVFVMAGKSMLQRNLIKHLLDSLLRPFVLGLTFIGNK